MKRQLKSILVTAVVAGTSLACHPVSAGIVDLSTFSVISEMVSLTSGLAILNVGDIYLQSSIGGVVENLESFDFRLQRSNGYDPQFAFLHFPENNSFVDLVSPYSANLDTGNLTYRFPAAYSGAIEFALDNGGGSPATLSIGNLRTTDVLSAVPEPEAYAMLLAGMGLVGCMARRGSRRGERFGLRGMFTRFR